MQRWKAVCCYDGSAFCGWQSQSNKLGVQDFLEARLQSIFKRHVRIHGSSRTDAGVHARQQVFHFDADWSHPPLCLLNAINSRLGRELQLSHIELVDDNFHARFSSQGKHYSYFILNRKANPFEWRYCWDIVRPLELQKMQEVANLFVGTHDFTAFSGKVQPGENTIKTLHSLQITNDSFLRFDFKGSGYLYRMVRKIVGALVMVSDGRLSCEKIRQLLAEPSKKIPITTAPARGLFLEEVYF